MAELVQHLESHGYVQRVPDPTDRRAKLVLPTRRGLEVIALAQSIAPAVEQQIRALVGTDRMRALRDDLETIRRAATEA
jgi:DNA-binding MarR family transcriptional regulator